MFTKAMQERLNRYGITLREENTDVYHPVYEKTTDCNPEQFALFQLAITALDAAWVYAPQVQDDRGVSVNDSFHKHHLRVATENEFALPVCTEGVTSAEQEKRWKQGSQDYAWACRQLGALYYDLLD